MSLFFVGGQQGHVFYTDESRCEELCKLNGAILSLMFYKKSQSIVLITSTLIFLQFRISTNQKSTPDKKVKLSLSASAEKIESEWIDPSSFVISSGEGIIRLWNVETDSNYNLSLADAQKDQGGITILTGKILTAKFDKRTQTLFSGTSDGRLVAWRNALKGIAPNSGEPWRNLSSVYLGQAISQITVGSAGVIGVKYGGNVSLVFETNLLGRYNDKLKVLQTSNTCLQIYFENTDNMEKLHLFDARMNVRNFDLRGKQLVVWNGQTAVICEVNTESEQVVTEVGSFQCQAKSLCFHKEGIILLKENSCEVVNYSGVVKQDTSFSKAEGDNVAFDYCKSNLVMFTTKNYLRVLDISKRELKVIGAIKKLDDIVNIENFSIKTIKMNCDGLLCCILLSIPPKNEKKVQEKFLVWNLENETFAEYLYSDSVIPESCAWETNDKRYFGIYGHMMNADQQQVKVVTTFFYSADSRILKHDQIEVEGIEGIYSIESPNFLFISKNSSLDASITYAIDKKFMKEFKGVENLDQLTISSILKFNYFLTIGNMDEAHKAIKHINSPEIWKNMAIMSIKTKRLDVAEICIANMKFARGAKALREVKRDGGDADARLATVAIQLNMIDVAEEL